jgi:hypothetical protein
MECNRIFRRYSHEPSSLSKLLFVQFLVDHVHLLAHTIACEGRLDLGMGVGK